MDLSFPIQDYIKYDNYKIFVDAAKLLNLSQFNECETMLIELADNLLSQDTLETHLILYKICKVNYLKGEFTSTLKDIETIIEALKPKLDNQDEDGKKTITNDEIYMYLKSLLMKGRTLDRIRDYVKSDEILDEITKYVNEQNET